MLSLIVMPVLAAAKTRVGKALKDNLILADAVATKICVLLSVSTLLGVGFSNRPAQPGLTLSADSSSRRSSSTKAAKRGPVNSLKMTTTEVQRCQYVVAIRRPAETPT